MAAWIKDVGEELPVREDITPMTLAREKRQSSQQASAFAEAAMQRHLLRTTSLWHGCDHAPDGLEDAQGGFWLFPKDQHGAVRGYSIAGRNRSRDNVEAVPRAH
jgi:hypothetical protein